MLKTKHKYTTATLFSVLKVNIYVNLNLYKYKFLLHVVPPVTI